MSGVRRWFRLRNVERDLDEELEFHRQERLRELAGRGLSAAAAREEAARMFGDERQYRRELLEIDRGAAAQERWRGRLHATRETVRHAARSVVRSPGLSFGIVLAFALGIGANATMFATVERLLLRPPAHIESPDEVRRLVVMRARGRIEAQQTIETQTVAWPDYLDFTRTTGFADVAAYASRQRTVGVGEEAERLRVVFTTANWWSLLGVRPALGRFYTAAEDVVGGTGVVVISHGYWQREFGGRADVIGRTIELPDGAWTIIGVTPRGFTGVDLRPVDAFMPFVSGLSREGDGWLESRNWHFLQAVARLAPDVTEEAAFAEATSHHRAGREGMPGYVDAQVKAAPLLAARGPDAPAEATVARWLFGVALIVLFIACLNVANLLLARMIRRGRETSIRLALGISRRRLVAQIVAEGVILGLAGGAAAVAVAAWGGTAVQRMLLPDIGWESAPTLLTVLLVGGLALLAGVGSAIAPAVQASRRNVTAGLKASAGGIGRSTARLRAIMSGLQAALSVVLLVGAGLFVRSLSQVRSADLGLDPWRVAIVTPQFEPGSIGADEDLRLFYEQAVERVRGLPAVEAAGAAIGVPFYSTYGYDMRVPGVDSIPRAPGGGPYVRFVDPGYFAALRIATRQGRVFDARDTGTSAHVVVLSESFARALWPDGSAMGRCVHVRGESPCAEVVGVVEDARRDGIQEELAYEYYAPIGQADNSNVDGLVVRARDDIDIAMRDVRSALLEADPRIRYVDMLPFESLLAPELRKWRLGATLFTLFGLLALGVAASGLYSVLAFDVAQRMREIGLRAALGATRSTIVGMIVSRAVRITAVGVAAGGAAAWLLAPRLEELLYGVAPRDPLTFGVVAGALLVVALVAAGVPARRAARLDPNMALRAE
jgi:predicted permease